MPARILIFTRMIVLFLSLAVPQVGATTFHDTQLWSFFWMRGPIQESKVWNYYVELQPRFDLNNTTESRFLFRPAIVYQLKNSQSLWLGVLDVFDSGFNTNELRVWQQYQRIDLLGSVQLLNRARFEQRFVSGAFGVGYRYRQMIRFQIPIGGSWSAVIFEELFVGLNRNKNQPVLGFDQNRAFVGFRRDFKSQLFYEVGYMNQYLASKINHNPMVTVGQVF